MWNPPESPSWERGREKAIQDKVESDTEGLLDKGRSGHGNTQDDCRRVVGYGHTQYEHKRKVGHDHTQDDHRRKVGR